MNNIYRHSLFS